jgi:hypothetical protein
MPGAGEMQVTMFDPCCLQVDCGSLPAASELWSVTVSALISALGAAFFGFSLADMDGIAALPLCELEPLTPGPDPQPATARISTASSASQRGWRYQPET